MTFTLGSMCTGYGGLDLAVAQVLNVEPAWVADPDPGAAAILGHHMPNVPNLGDITTIDWTTVPTIDVLCGGYPCQPFSVAGQRKGTADDRHLWPHIATALRVLRPRLAIFENVANHLRLGFADVLADLADLGFDAEWCLASASEIGAPHQRRRLFVLAWPADTDGPGLEGPGLRRAAPEHRGPAEDPDRAARGERRIAAPGQTEGGRTWADSGRRSGASAADAPGDGRRNVGSAQFGGVASTALGSPVADAARDGRHERRPESARLVGGSDASFGGYATEWGAYEPAIRRWEHILGRPAPRPVEPGRTGDRLSPGFVEWLMGLPDGWVTAVPALTRNQQLKALGNGVVPQQGAAASAHLLTRAASARSEPEVAA